jgi:diacylglycerol kinase (ATP)
MQITLMHNPKAGTELSAKTELVREFERAGHSVAYYSTKKKNAYRALENPGSIVVIAGGDGTIRKVASRLIGRNVPIAILPYGTANNIAKALGLGQTPEVLINSLAAARSIKFDVGIARGPWGDMPFLEAAGVGLFPRMLAELSSSLKKLANNPVTIHGSVQGGVYLLQRLLSSHRARNYEIKLDGKELSGRSLLIEVMNITSIGPGLQFAPQAQCGDGLLDLVIARETDRKKLERHLASTKPKWDEDTFSLHRTRQIQLSCLADEFHYDDALWRAGTDRGTTEKSGAPRKLSVEFEVFPGALRVLVPSS